MTSKHMSPNHREALTAVSSITGLDEYVTSTNGILDGNATISGQVIPATSLTTAVAVQIVDGSGNQIASFGGGTQYIDGGVPPAHPTGTTIEWSDGANWQTVSTAKPLPVTASFSPSGTQDVNVTKIGGNAVTTTVPVSGTVAVTQSTSPWVNNTSQINGVTPLMGNGVTGTGSQRVTIASDNTAFSVNATLSAETTKVIGTVNQGTSPWIVAGGGTAGSAATGVATIQGIASMTPVQVSQATASNLNAQMVGNIADAAADSGNPVKVGAKYNATKPTYTDGQRGDLQIGTRGSTAVSLFVNDSTIAQSFMADNADGAAASATANKMAIITRNTIFNGTTYDRAPGTTSGAYQIVRDAAGNARGVNVTAGNAGQVDLTSVAGTAIVNGGVAGSQSVGGTVATNVAITANPLNLGAQAVSSENAAVTTARQVQLVADLVGKLIVLPYANPENFVSGAATATDTTSTSLIAAPASGLRNYITQITVWNSSAVNTYIKIQDGSGGTTLYTLPCPTVGGSVITLPTPLRQPTTATAIFFAANASANAVFVSASGFKGL
jgi:hypothetical protein